MGRKPAGSKKSTLAYKSLASPVNELSVSASPAFTSGADG